MSEECMFSSSISCGTNKIEYSCSSFLHTVRVVNYSRNDSSSMKKTRVINFIAGPGAGKSVMAAMIFVKLKLAGHTVEYLQEYAKGLVWTKDYTTLNNQHWVTQRQYQSLKQMEGHVEYVVTDGPLVQGIYYNMHNPDNTSNVEKTQKMILECHSQFNNINIFLDRGQHFSYETAGRLQTEDEAREIDVILKHLLRQNGVIYKTFSSSLDEKNLTAIIDYIKSVSVEISGIDSILPHAS